MIEISYYQLETGQTLQDGDVVVASSNTGSIGSSRIGIALRLSGGVTWWKGLQSGGIVLCQCQDSQSYASAELDLADFQANGLQLWKAKLFGVHTQMYDVVDAKTEMKGGNSYLFLWGRDS